jgi:hypothetical protein
MMHLFNRMRAENTGASQQTSQLSSFIRTALSFLHSLWSWGSGQDSHNLDLAHKSLLLQSGAQYVLEGMPSFEEETKAQDKYRALFWVSMAALLE